MHEADQQQEQEEQEKRQKPKRKEKFQIPSLHKNYLLEIPSIRFYLPIPTSFCFLLCLFAVLKNKKRILEITFIVLQPLSIIATAALGQPKDEKQFVNAFEEWLLL